MKMKKHVDTSTQPVLTANRIIFFLMQKKIKCVKVITLFFDIG